MEWWLFNLRINGNDPVIKSSVHREKIVYQVLQMQKKVIYFTCEMWLTGCTWNNSFFSLLYFFCHLFCVSIFNIICYHSVQTEPVVPKIANMALESIQYLLYKNHINIYADGRAKALMCKIYRRHFNPLFLRLIYHWTFLEIKPETR